MRAHPIRGRRATMVVAVSLLVAGSWLLADAYERRGHTRPWYVRMLPGV